MSEQRTPKTRLTWEILMCEVGMRGWLVKHNLVTQEIDITGRTMLSKRPLCLDDMITVLHSDLGENFKGCTLDNIGAYLTYIARENSYNPVLDHLASLQWDGKDHTQEVFELLGIQDDDLSKVLVRKWLLQTVALLYNDEENPFGADGVLVLNGIQGAGKTSFFRKLALRPEWFGEGATIKDNDKDTLRRCVTRWIVELGEVESTLKSDISALKAFVTSDIDVYRMPYARSDRKTARRASLCATCNSERYLIDPTGNRRWWSVPVTIMMDYDRIQAFDANQLWAQIYALVSPLDQKERAACFRLTRAEQQALAVRNGEFEKPMKGELECRDLLEEAKANDFTFTLMTTSQWKQENIDVLRPYSANQIGAALAKIGLEQVKTKKMRGYMLPTRVQLPYEIRRIK